MHAAYWAVVTQLSKAVFTGKFIGFLISNCIRSTLHASVAERLSPSSLEVSVIKHFFG